MGARQYDEEVVVGLSERFGTAESRALTEWCFQRLASGLTIPEPEDLSDLTVIIPSYERGEFLLRQLVYWAGTKARVVLMDGSAAPLPEEVVSLIEERPEFVYVHRPGGIAKRLNEACGFITTPFTVLLADDEFHLRRGLGRAIEFLRSDQEAIACTGQSLRFVPSPDRKFLAFSEGYSFQRHSTRYADSWQDNSIRDANPRQRLVKAMTPYTCMTCYSVTRTEAWVKSWGSLRDWSLPVVIELQQAFALWCLGELATIDEVQFLVSGENVSVNELLDPDLAVRAGLSAAHQVDRWWNSGDYDSEPDEFVDLLADIAVEAGQVNVADARSLISDGVVAYIRQQPDWSDRLDPKWFSGVGRTVLSAVDPQVRASGHSTFSRHLRVRVRDWIYRVQWRWRRGRYYGHEPIELLADSGVIPRSGVSAELLAELRAIECIVREFSLVA